MSLEFEAIQRKLVLKRSGLRCYWPGTWVRRKAQYSRGTGIREAITESSMVTQGGKSSSALAHARIAVAVEVSFPMEQAILWLRPDWAQEAAPDELAGERQNQQSSQFHRLPAPGQFAAR